jgi:hypothetical protein
MGRTILDSDTVGIPASEIRQGVTIDALHFSKIQNYWKILSVEGRLQF